MMDWTDRHDRYFLRLISRHALLYTEMLTADAVIHGDLDRLLGHSSQEHPLALQLGGSDPEKMARAAVIGAAHGYDEININVGCPSDRVQSGRFGACLMAEPETVSACIKAMGAAVDIPITVKCRIGIDGRGSFEDLLHFVEQVAAAGCGIFVIHARIAILSGLSPKDNRNVPPLRYDLVHELKRRRPDLRIILNGGLADVTDARGHLEDLDGVMFGRAAYQNPYCLAMVDRLYFNDDHQIPSRHEIALDFADYADEQCRAGFRLNAMSRHIMGLFQGLPGAKAWRRYLSEQAHLADVGGDVIRAAAGLVPELEPQEWPVQETGHGLREAKG